jgi:hypothetical protein
MMKPRESLVNAGSLLLVGAVAVILATMSACSDKGSGGGVGEAAAWADKTLAGLSLEKKIG